MDHMRFIAYQIFVEEKAYSIDETASAVGRKYGWIYDIWERDLKSTLYEKFKILYKITGDLRFIQAMLHNTGCVAIAEKDSALKVLRDINQFATHIVKATAPFTTPVSPGIRIQLGE
ncbi:MAG: hypothetical protein PHC43_01080 [Candidatus Marinimicrobia bacterium]|nr:hypothetical protein [Candidatus Neomarinimicrobiota bacterium]MDD5539868.1 hypothetical protein [Candidatus Neomarinimicrobiota bacterium]